MFSFFKRKNRKPSFRVIRNYHQRGCYFLRNAGWSLLDNEDILVTEPHSLKQVTLTGWPRFLFLAANGQQSIEAFIHFIAAQYKDNIPVELDKAIIFGLKDLEKKNLVIIADKKTVVPEAFEHPGLNGTR